MAPVGSLGRSGSAIVRGCGQLRAIVHPNRPHPSASTAKSPGSPRISTGSSRARSCSRPAWTRTRSPTGASIDRLHLLYRGVYAVGHRPPSPSRTRDGGRARVRTRRRAQPPLGRRAVGHRSLARTSIDVTAQGKRSRPSVRLHRSRTLHADDVTHHHGIPVTTPARTLLDLADVLDDASLTRAVNDARLQRRLTSTTSPRSSPAPPAAPPPAQAAHRPRHTAHPLALRGRLPHLRRAPWPPAPRGQPADSRLRGRHALARPARDRRARRLGVPRREGRVRCRPRQGCRPPRRRVPRRAGHVGAAERRPRDARQDACDGCSGMRTWAVDRVSPVQALERDRPTAGPRRHAGEAAGLDRPPRAGAADAR